MGKSLYSQNWEEEKIHLAKMYLRIKDETLPSPSVHVVLHYHVAVDTEHAPAHLHLVLEEFGYVITRLQQEHSRRVCQKDLYANIEHWRLVSAKGLYS